MITANPVGKRKQATTFKARAKVRLVELGLTVVELAKTLNLSRTAVSVAINHKSKYPTVKKAVAKEIGL